MASTWKSAFGLFSWTSFPSAELLPALPVSQLPDDPQEGWSPHNPGLSDRQKAEPLPHAPLPL